VELLLLVRACEAIVDHQSGIAGKFLLQNKRDIEIGALSQKKKKLEDATNFFPTRTNLGKRLDAGCTCRFDACQKPFPREHTSLYINICKT
jgi:hypothetical protein